MNVTTHGCVGSSWRVYLPVTTPPTPLNDAHLGGLLVSGGSKMQFAKPPLAYDEQLAQLIERGMVISDRSRALHYLREISYYRLGAYWLPFEADHASHQLMPNTRFDDVLNSYIFDRELRLLVMDAIERIEVSLRARWSYHMAHEHGPHCLLDASCFGSSWPYGKHREKLETDVQKSQEVFIRHLRSTYDEALPPIWAAVEIMTFGQLSQWFKGTRRRGDRNAVARSYGFDERTLVSFLHHLTIVRNLCAHHARLWNRELTFKPVLPTKVDQLAQALNPAQPRRLYNTLIQLLYLMNIVNPGHHWKARLIALMNEHEVHPVDMGFPDDWEDRALWQ